MNKITHASPLDLYEVKSGATIHPGALVALDGDGKAVSAADTAEITVIGVAARIFDGCCEVESGIVALAGDAVPRTARGKAVYVKDANTVNLTGGTNKIHSGIVVDVYDGDVYVDLSPAALAASGAWAK